MGTTSAEIQRQIVDLRDDITAAADEVERRMRGMVSPSGVLQLVGANPKVVGGIVAGVVLVGLIAASSSKVNSRVKERRATREAADAAVVAMASPARGGGGGGGGGGDYGMLKRLLWSALTAALMAIGGLVARRLSSTLWKAAMQEEPPTS